MAVASFDLGPRASSCQNLDSMPLGSIERHDLIKLLAIARVQCRVAGDDDSICGVAWLR